jgi:hypothetical protein
MRRVAVWIFFLASLSRVAAADPPGPPALPFLDWKACPFEGCAYRVWTASQPVTIYDTYKEKRHAIASVAKGDKVTGVTGVVITVRPGVIRMDRDLPMQEVKQGDTIQTYSYRGEGFSAVWINGRYEPSFDISFTKWPNGQGCGGDHCAATYVDLGEKHWWAQVTLKNGATGWVNMDELSFDGIDMRGT